MENILKNDNYKVIAIGVLAFIVIGLYGKYRCTHPDYHDPLMKAFGVADLDGWSVMHFALFFMLGYLYPNTMLVSMSMGIGWELFEELLGKNRPAFLGGFGDCMTTDPAIQGSWWFGRISDIIVNFIGFVVGVWMRKNI